MWILGIATGVACCFSFAYQHIYAAAGLNLYYVFVSFWGLKQWKADEGKLKEKESGHKKGGIHLNKLGVGTIVLSTVIFLAGSALLILLLRLLGDPETEIDAVTTVLSAIATWWLAKSYPQQWLIWIAADLFSTLLCIMGGMHWSMAVMYIFYTLAAVYGYMHWKKKGETVG